MKKCVLISVLGLLTFGCADEGVDSSSDLNCGRFGQVEYKGRCVATCSANNPCVGISVCENNICIPRDAECTFEERRCSDDFSQVLVCANGLEFSVAETCGTGRICHTGQCIDAACENGKMRCLNNNVEICKNNSFMLYSECTLSQVCDEVSFECIDLKECINEQKRCLPTGEVQSCIDGKWERILDCPFGCSTDYTCKTSALCTGSQTECTGTEYKKCVNGQWEISSCFYDKHCEDNRCVDGCVSGVKMCSSDGKSIELCKDGKYTQDTVCKTDEKCLVEGGIPKCEYAESESSCGNGQLDAGEPCDGSKIASGLSCVTEMGAGYTGTLSCSTDCKINVSECKSGSSSGGDSGSSGGWDYEMTFEEVKECNTYTPNPVRTESKDGITWTISAMIGTLSAHLIDGQSVIMKSDKKTYIEVSGLTKGIGRLSFDILAWGAKEVGPVRLTAGSFVDKNISATSDLKVKNYNSTLNVNASSFKIDYPDTSSSVGRVIIDNIRWTNL